jgi:hypothetical protein
MISDAGEAEASYPFGLEDIATPSQAIDLAAVTTTHFQFSFSVATTHGAMTCFHK